MEPSIKGQICKLIKDPEGKINELISILYEQFIKIILNSDRSSAFFDELNTLANFKPENVSEEFWTYIQIIFYQTLYALRAENLPTYHFPLNITNSYYLTTIIHLQQNVKDQVFFHDWAVKMFEQSLICFFQNPPPVYFYTITHSNTVISLPLLLEKFKVHNT